MNTVGRPPGSHTKYGRALRRVPLREPEVRWLAAVGERMRELREEQDIAASEVAAALDVNEITIHKWESGRNAPMLANVYRYATAIGVRPSDIVEVEL